MKTNLLSLILFTGLILGLSCSKDDDSPKGLPQLPALPNPNDVCSGMDDPTFKAYCIENFDTNKDGKLSPKEADAILDIECPEMGIKSMKGIEYFSNLQTVRCFRNELTELNCRYNSKLTVLKCYENSITSLDVTQNKELVSFSCDQNHISSLDVTQNLRLRLIGCSDNKLSTLDITNNLSLETLYCRNNLFTKIDISKNINLEWLYCDGNEYLEEIDLANCGQMKTIPPDFCKDCFTLQIIKLPASILSIASRVFQNCDNLHDIYCSATTPPTWYYSGDIISHAYIYVPKESINLYRSATSWSQSANILPIQK